MSCPSFASVDWPEGGYRLPAHQESKKMRNLLAVIVGSRLEKRGSAGACGSQDGLRSQEMLASLPLGQEETNQRCKGTGFAI